MSKATELTGDNFRSAIANGVALVDFWAEWCGPCKMMGPVIDEVAAQYEGKVSVGKVNVDNEGALAQEFGIASIPTLIILKNGEETKRFIGVTSKAVLAQALHAACA